MVIIAARNDDLTSNCLHQNLDNHIIMLNYAFDDHYDIQNLVIN
jgi:hypothetical protein